MNISIIESLEDADRDKLVAAIIKYGNRYEVSELETYTNKQLAQLLSFLFIDSQNQYEQSSLFF